MDNIDQPKPNISRHGLNAAFSPIIGRLIRIIEARYGCRFRYVPFNEGYEAHPDISVVHSLLSKNSSVTLDGNLLLPIRLHNELWGYAEFSTGQKLDAKEIHEIEDLLDLALSSTLVTIDNLRDLTRIEDEIHLTEMLPANVVRLSSFKRKRTLELAPSGEIDLDKYAEAAPRRLAFSIPCLIEGQTYSDLHKMATALHESSGRPIFVHFEDLSTETKDCARLLSELHGATVFIPDVSSLLENEIITLIDWLSGPRTKESPQIIAGTVFSYAELIHEGNEAMRVLLRRMAVAHLRMEESFDHYQNYGIVEFFYDSLTGHSVEDRLL